MSDSLQTHVLIVEDDRDVLRDMYSTLEEHIRRRSLRHISIVTATYLADARAKLRDKEHLPAVVSTDLGYPRTFMGKIDPLAGAELVHEIRARSTMKSVIYSGQTIATAKQMLSHIGALESDNDPGLVFLQKRLDTSHDAWARSVLDAMFRR